jgi:hypothetical protein
MFLSMAKIFEIYHAYINMVVPLRYTIYTIFSIYCYNNYIESIYNNIKYIIKITIKFNTIICI